MDWSIPVVKTTDHTIQPLSGFLTPSIPARSAGPALRAPRGERVASANLSVGKTGDGSHEWPSRVRGRNSRKTYAERGSFERGIRISER